MVQFCETYLRSVSSREVADFKSTTESQLHHFTVFEVYTVIHIQNMCSYMKYKYMKYKTLCAC